MCTENTCRSTIPKKFTSTLDEVNVWDCWRDKWNFYYFWNFIRNLEFLPFFFSRVVPCSNNNQPGNVKAAKVFVNSMQIEFAVDFSCLWHAFFFICLRCVSWPGRIAVILLLYSRKQRQKWSSVAIHFKTLGALHWNVKYSPVSIPVKK